MAYPFPRFDGSPKTPQDLRQRKFSHLSYRRRTNSHCDAFTPRVALLTGAILAILLLSYIFHAVFESSRQQHDLLPILRDLHQDYFTHFEGHQDCGIQSTALYVPPAMVGKSSVNEFPFCKNRATLLQAMSGGGRHGFDAPFTPQGCHYRWYNTEEICMILERFDGVVFIGDDMIRQVYTGFNILLRENLAMGGLEHWRMPDAERYACRCDNQLMKPECQGFSVTSSEEVSKNDPREAINWPYLCNRTPHFLIPIADTPADEGSHKRLSDLLAKDPDSYKAVPIIWSLGLSGSLSWETARRSMDEWLPIAEMSLRNTPILWVGPDAAGHLKPPGRILQEGNNALWHYTVELGKEARARGMETLGMYNMTIQASSWDGTNYGLRVKLVQAMMIINWLSRLE